jgi:hypothetical protein
MNNHRKNYCQVFLAFQNNLFTTNKMKKIKFVKTERGFAISSFEDRYGLQCSLQKSSLATEDAIWLGVDSVDGKPARMHLTREMVANLLPALKMANFQKTNNVTD